MTVDDEERKLIVHFAKKFLERLELCSKMVPDGSGAAVYEDPQTYALTLPSDEKTILSAEALEKACSDVDVEDGVDELIHPKFMSLPEVPEGETTTEERSVPDVGIEPTVVDPLVEAKKKMDPGSTTTKDFDASGDEKAGDETPETDDEETRALDSKELSAIFERVKSLEARTTKLESEAKDRAESDSAESDEPRGEEPFIESALVAVDEILGGDDESDLTANQLPPLRQRKPRRPQGGRALPPMSEPGTPPVD